MGEPDQGHVGIRDGLDEASHGRGHGGENTRDGRDGRVLGYHWTAGALGTRLQV